MRMVIKVGTSTLTHKTGKLNIRVFEELTKVISNLKNSGIEVILVSSGAIGMGAGKLGLPGRPADIPTKQAAAAVGQSELMYMYDKFFGEYNHTVAQMLLTANDFEDEVKHENLTNTLVRLLELGTLPIINENDTVSTAELSIGDNDTLSALVAIDAKADMLVLISDIEGLYTADPHKDKNAKLISVVENVDRRRHRIGARHRRYGYETAGGKACDRGGNRYDNSQRGRPRRALRYSRGRKNGNAVFKEEEII